MVKKLGIRLLWVVSFVLIIPLIFILIVSIGAFGIMQSEKELQQYKNANASVVLAHDGKLIGKIFTENRTDITYKQLPPHLVHALVATEDVRFFRHKGIDSRSLARVFIKTILLRKESAGGGSTITEQLAKNMFGRKNNGPFAIFINKTKEAMLAHRLERVFNKEEIITLYLNTVPFGENVYGIGAAAHRYFDKETSLLNIQESAVLVGMLKANNLYNPRMNPQNSVKRRNLVIHQMHKYNYITKAAADSLAALPLELNYANLETEGPADYFVYQVKNEATRILGDIYRSTGKRYNMEQDGLIITTTLDIDLQKSANKAFHDHLSKMQEKLDKQYNRGAGRKYITSLTSRELEKQNPGDSAKTIRPRLIFDWHGPTVDTISLADSMAHSIKQLHAGLLAMDPVTGDIKAWVGGINFRTNPYDQVLARRQTGSTFKPILYSEAFEEGIRPCDYLDNDSIVIESEDTWSPSNFDHSYGGKYTLTGALVHSMNIPTFNLFMQISFNRLDSLWHRMGFTFPISNHPSLALGTAEASIGELAVAYSAFANGGLKISPRKLISIATKDGKVIWRDEANSPRYRILSLRTTELINAILQKAVREGTGSSLRGIYGITVPLAGKTGTTQDYGDAWFVAYNPGLVIVSRVGAAYPSIHFVSGSDGSGGSLALPLVALTMKNLPAGISGLYKPFSSLPDDLSGAFDCPEYRENNVFDNFTHIFKRNRIDWEEHPGKKKKSFFRRLFGLKKR